MTKLFQRALFIFRRDLRLEDNTGLIYALKNAKEVILAFVFTPDQIESNPYRSDHCLQFMIESLEDLEKTANSKGGEFYLFFGKPEDIVKRCIDEVGVDLVVVNRDYTPYSFRRDQKIYNTCQKHDVAFQALDDALLHAPEQTVKKDGKPYTVFTPYYRNACQLEVRPPVANPHGHYYVEDIPFAVDISIYQEILPKRTPLQCGGRTEAIKILKTIGDYTSYEEKRDFPELSTTLLSSHLKFTTCSPRELYWAVAKQLGPSSGLIRALFWRDFFTCIGFFFPHVFSGSFHSKYDQLEWSDSTDNFSAWCEGRTGFPIVDAGMRELQATGFMHNRVRMIAASLLVKDLHIDWRWGEKYFAQTLVDYDPAVNNGNWQWVASTGCDAQPYFRIFNPWNQGAKFDPDCIYIKRWIPELGGVAPSVIHRWNMEQYWSQCPSYPSPIVDHSREATIALQAYKKVKNAAFLAES